MNWLIYFGGFWVGFTILGFFIRGSQAGNPMKFFLVFCWFISWIWICWKFI